MKEKLITFAVPCYNSQDYMQRCLRSLMAGGEEVEIIVIDDGSTDRTGEIADCYAEKYPETVRAVHQKNGGHGAGVNKGLSLAAGEYFKVVDSDDWLDEESLKELLSELREWEWQEKEVDLVVCNYVYDHLYENKTKPMRYTNVFPEKKICTWNDMGNFKPSQYLVMHALLYRTQILRDCRLQLPKHTFYVDNIFVYQPLPYVKSMYYMDLDLYRYFIGRADQSVNESVMVKRVDQQLRVTKHMIDCQDLDALQHEKRLRAYMLHYLSMMMTVSDIFLLLDGTPEAYTKKKELWQYLKDHVSPKVYCSVVLSLGGVSNVNVPGGDKVVLGCYRLAKKLFKFN